MACQSLCRGAILVGGVPEKASAVVVLSCDALGVPSPPVPVHLRFLRWQRGWSLAVHATEPWSPAEMRAWAAAFSAEGFHVASEGRVAWFDKVQAPAPLEAVLAEFSVLEMSVLPSGRARLRIEGDPARVAHALRGSGVVLHAPGEEDEAAPAERSVLTPRQAEAIAAAAAAGYYRIPRPTNLREMAAQMGTTSAALSELLRRAEAAIILDYLARAASPPRPRRPAGERAGLLKPGAPVRRAGP